MDRRIRRLAYSVRPARVLELVWHLPRILSASSAGTVRSIRDQLDRRHTAFPAAVLCKLHFLLLLKDARHDGSHALGTFLRSHI